MSVPQIARMVRWASWRVRLGKILGAPSPEELLLEDSSDHSSITVRTDWLNSSLVFRSSTMSMVVLVDRSMVSACLDWGCNLMKVRQW